MRSCIISICFSVCMDKVKMHFAETNLVHGEYDIVGAWFKCNMTDVHAAIGLAQMNRYEDILKRRKDIIERYDMAFKDLSVKVLEHYTNIYQSSGHLYIMRLFDKYDNAGEIGN